MRSSTNLRGRCKLNIYSFGFSLVEVVLSLGIISFAILPMIALLPLGLSSFHASQEISLSSQTRQEILANLQQTPVNSLLGGNSSYSETNYFDEEGILLGKLTPSGSTLSGNASPIYQVSVNVSNYSGGTTPISLPEADSSIPATNLLNSVMVITKFTRIGGGASSGVGSNFRTSTDYLFYKHP